MVDLDALKHATDAFAIFGLPRKFALDPAALEKRFAELSRETHPDLAGDDPDKQLDAMNLSAKVNDAYRTLADDEARANLLLELLGGPTKDADRRLPDGFLPIIMSVREDLADAQLEGDEARITAIEADAKAQRAARLSEIARLFSAGISPDHLSHIRLELNALRYYQRLLEQVHGQEREM